MRFRKQHSEYAQYAERLRWQAARTLLSVVAILACLAVGLALALYATRGNASNAAEPLIRTTVTIPGHPRTVHVPARTIYTNGKTVHVPAHTVVLPPETKTRVVSGPLTTVNGVIFRTETISRTVVAPGTTITGPTSTVVSTTTLPATTVTDTFTTTATTTTTVPTTITTTVTTTSTT